VQEQGDEHGHTFFAGNIGVPSGCSLQVPVRSSTSESGSLVVTSHGIAACE
jgi:hypothetical protein